MPTDSASNFGQWLLSTVQQLVVAGAVAEEQPSADDGAERDRVEDSHLARDGDRQADPATAGEKDVQQAESPVSVQSVVEWSNQFQEITSDLDLILALLTGLGVAIAVSSILNTMLMSVTERIVEFGILRANGWSERNIVKLITCEAALLGVAGGLLGVALGWVATQVVNSVWADRIHLHAGPLLLVSSLLFAIVMGMMGGFYPALRAARLSPMEAIRRG